jgi:3-deoxy-D-manno-octulosonic-acid transferase
MDPWLIPYNLAAGTAAAALPPVWLGSRLAGRWAQVWPRLGLYRDLAPARPGPRVWLQAVSVGEVQVAWAVARALWRRLPQVQLTVSASTDTGLARARELFGPRAAVAPFPLEAPWAVAAAWRKIRPQVYASVETELWPNLLAFLQARGVELLLLNGRISPRSFPRYRRLGGLAARMLRRFSRLSMITAADAGRAVALGADPARVGVDGNAKYAGLAERARPGEARALAGRLALAGAPLLVAGSVRSGEEAPVLEAFARLGRRRPEAVLAVAPRHVERAGRWLEACRARGLEARLWSSLDDARFRRPETKVVVVDAMGVLMPLYGLAAGALVGASLAPLGGQNPLEPAAWGLAVAHGPDMADFADAAEALEAAGGGARVAGPEELAAFWDRALEGGLEEAGRAARATALRFSGAAEAAAGHLAEALERAGRRRAA